MTLYVYIIVSMFLSIIFVSPSITFAQDVDTTITEIPNIPSFLEAVSNKHWPLVVAFGVTFVVYFVRVFIKDRLDSKSVPWVILGCTIMSTASARIIQSISQDGMWWHGLIQGILEGATIGLSAMGFWSAGVKNVMPKQ